MSPEAQRIAIAEACGIVSKDRWGPLYKTPRGIMRDCPDYLADLNAMHEAEKVFEGYGMRQSYRRNLLIACDTTEPNEVISATAAQRAEAFLLTIGKWEGAK
tara:strand:- start:593 stop:898 length:306 start_codon:yes stop_codon:yes gene_type:complete